MRTDRVVVITGGAGGIGAYLVERFLANGDTVVATDVSEKALAELPVKESGPKLLTVAADITDEAGCTSSRRSPPAPRTVSTC
jgi:NAD(P)-dependent dehydrogenase (short-subunit alcohol dehydrogenase family)